MNAKRSFYNVFFGLLSQVITIAMGIVIPRLVIVNLGSEANGLLSSVNQALVYLNLLEAGIGTATLQALYKPVATGDHGQVNAVLSATNRYYQRVGTGYFAAVLVLAVVYPMVIRSTLDPLTIFLVIAFSGMSQVVNFFFQGKYRILMQAEGKNYILTNLGTITTICTSTLKIILLLSGCNVAILQGMYFAFSLLQMLYICIYIRRNYKWIDLSVKPDLESLSQRNAVLIHQISGLIFSNTDVLILTYFTGLKTVSVYSMYVMLYGMIGGAISTINGGFSFALGQAYKTDRNKFMKLYNAFESYNMALTFSLYCIAGAFILPFLKLYTDGVGDISYIDAYLPYLFIITYLLSNGRSAAQRVIEYAGHFKLTQNRSLLESAINLTVSLLAVHHFGIYGVLIGTIIALFYRSNDMILYSSKHLLKRSAWTTYRKWITNALLFVICSVLMHIVLGRVSLDSYIAVILWAVVACIVVIPLFFAAASVLDRESFRYCMDFIRSKISSSAKLRAIFRHK